MLCSRPPLPSSKDFSGGRFFPWSFSYSCSEGFGKWEESRRQSNLKDLDFQLKDFQPVSIRTAVFNKRLTCSLKMRERGLMKLQMASMVKDSTSSERVTLTSSSHCPSSFFPRV